MKNGLPDQRSDPTFLGRLESLRGVAALCVAIYHSLIWMPVQDQSVSIMPISAVHGWQGIVARAIIGACYGASWVAFFFVLSGFVLACSLQTSRFTVPNWLRFIGRRALRIMPTLIASLLLVVALLAVRSRYHLFANAYDWIAGWKFTTASIGEFGRNAALLSTSLNPPAWTLQSEMMAALFFPLVVALAGRLSAPANLAVLAVIVVTAYFPDLVPPGVAWVGSLSAIMFVNFNFFMGVLCAKYHKQLVARLSDRGLSLVALGALCLVSVPSLFAPGYDTRSMFLVAVGAFGLTAVCANRRAAFGLGWLDKPALRFLGRVSFSFYLLHYPLLYVTTTVLTHYQVAYIWNAFPILYLAVSALLSIAICLAAAWLLHRFVEVPSTRLGKRWFSAARGKGDAQPGPFGAPSSA